MEDVHPQLPAQPGKRERPRLVVVGAGDMSLPLVSLARTLGFHMTVVDPRPELATRERFPDADELLVGDASGIVADLPLSASTSVVLTIHDQDVEIPVLRAVLASQAGYVGMLGSRKRGRRVLEILRAQGVAPERLARVQVPVGLDIGAQTPAEIALSVVAQLARLNEIDDLAVYVKPPGSIAREGERIGGAKIVPFVTRRERLAAAEGIAAGGLLRVRRFLPVRVAALVEDSVEERMLSRARRALEEKLAFFGSDLMLVERIPLATDAVTDALRGALRSGAELIVLAGGNPMDPLDPALLALERAGARMEKHGIPAQPGTLLWLAYAGAVPVIGAPSCGLFAKATALDLLLPPLLAGERLSRAAVAALGAGGLITPEVAWRLAPYRAGSARGQLDPE